MPGANIPERAPVYDLLAGVVLQAGAAQALALAPQPGVEISVSGDFLIQYGVRFLGKPERYIVPELVVLDYGDMLAGEEAWSFLWHRSNLHPRAEVVGCRDDGSEDIVFFRALDLSLPPQVLVLSSTGALLARPTALVAPDAAGLPARLVEYLPRYASVTDWLAGM
jgi:hypothetical protein